ncbi:hypothetical protein [Streptomyces hokutonensis]
MDELRVMTDGPFGKVDCPTVYATPEPGVLPIPEDILREAARARGWL